MCAHLGRTRRLSKLRRKAFHNIQQNLAVKSTPTACCSYAFVVLLRYYCDRSQNYRVSELSRGTENEEKTTDTVTETRHLNGSGQDESRGAQVSLSMSLAVFVAGVGSLGGYIYSLPSMVLI